MVARCRAEGRRLVYQRPQTGPSTLHRLLASWQFIEGGIMKTVTKSELPEMLRQAVINTGGAAVHNVQNAQSNKPKRSGKKIKQS
jgi:hypothetical protein